MNIDFQTLQTTVAGLITAVGLKVLGYPTPEQPLAIRTCAAAAAVGK